MHMHMDRQARHLDHMAVFDIDDEHDTALVLLVGEETPRWVRTDELRSNAHWQELTSLRRKFAVCTHACMRTHAPCTCTSQ